MNSEKGMSVSYFMPNYMSGCDGNTSLVVEIDTLSMISKNVTKINKNLTPEMWLD